MDKPTSIQLARRLTTCFGFRATTEGIVEAANVLLDFDADGASVAVSAFLRRHPRWPGIQAFAEFVRQGLEDESGRDPVTQQLNRIRALPCQQPATDATWAELERVMREKARDMAHMRRAIDHWLEISPWLPTPYDLGEALRTTTVALDPAGCEKCQGSGFRQVRRPYRNPATGETEIATGVEPCDCLQAIRARAAASLPPGSPDAA